MSLFNRRFISTAQKHASISRYVFNVYNTQCHYFSTDNNKDKTHFTPVKKQIVWGAGMAGGAITLYGISTMLYSVTSSLMTLTPMTSLYYGFVGGFITAAAGSSVFMTSARLTHIHPDAAWHAALKVIDNDKSAGAVIGRRTGSSSAAVKAYKHTRGGLTVLNGRPAWVKPTVDLLVRVSGEKSDVLASVRVSRDKLLGPAAVSYLCLEFKDQPHHSGELLLVGDSKDEVLLQSMQKSFKL